MAYSANLEVHVVLTAKALAALRKEIQTAVDMATKNNPIKLNNIELGKSAAKKMASEIQKAINDALKNAQYTVPPIKPPAAGTGKGGSGGGSDIVEARRLAAAASRTNAAFNSALTASDEQLNTQRVKAAENALRDYEDATKATGAAQKQLVQDVLDTASAIKQESDQISRINKTVETTANDYSRLSAVRSQINTLFKGGDLLRTDTAKESIKQSASDLLKEWERLSTLMATGKFTPQNKAELDDLVQSAINLREQLDGVKRAEASVAGQETNIGRLSTAMKELEGLRKEMQGVSDEQKRNQLLAQQEQLYRKIGSAMRDTSTYQNPSLIAGFEGSSRQLGLDTLLQRIHEAQAAVSSAYSKLGADASSSLSADNSDLLQKQSLLLTDINALKQKGVNLSSQELDWARQQTSAYEQAATAVTQKANEELSGLERIKTEVTEATSAASRLKDVKKRLDSIFNESDLLRTSSSKGAIQSSVSALLKEYESLARQLSSGNLQPGFGAGVDQLIGKVINLREQLDGVKRAEAELSKQETIFGRLSASLKELGEIEKDAEKVTGATRKNEILQERKRIYDQLIVSMREASTYQDDTVAANYEQRIRETQLGILQERVTAGKNGLEAFGVTDSEEVNRLLSESADITAKINALKQAGVTITREDVQALRARTDVFSQSAAQQRELLSLEKQAAALTQRITNYMASNPRSVSKYGNEFTSVLESISGSNLNSDSIAAATRRFIELQASMRGAGLEGRGVIQILSEGWKRFGTWSLVTRAFTIATTKLKKMVENVKELDAAMTELRKVTDLTASEYSRFFSQAVDLASDVGATVSDTINSVADFARLGYSVSEASDLAKAALMYKNVGDGITDVSAATEQLISTMKGFGKEASDASRIVDMFNEVGNNFSVSAVGIGEALQRSAASLSAAGNSIEESIGLVTGINSVLQNAEQTGTVLKTLSMYLRAAKTEAEAAGIETDGMATSVSKLRSEVLALTGQKVDIMVDDKNFKSTFQIMKEIAGVWDDLSDVTRARLGELLAGKRNSNALYALIQNFDEAEAAAKSAMDSFGSAAIENEKYLDSIAGKIAQYKAQFETFSANVVGSEVVKGVVDLGTALLKVLNALSGIHALLPLITTAIAGIANHRRNKSFDKMITEVITLKQMGKDGSELLTMMAAKFSQLSAKQQEFILKQGGASEALAILQRNLSNQNGSLDAFGNTAQRTSGRFATLRASFATAGEAAANAGGKIKGFGAKIKSLFTSLSAVSKTLLVIAAIEAVISAIRWGINKIKQSKQEAIEAANQIAEAYKDAQSTAKSNKSTLIGLKSEFEELSKGVDANGKNVGLASDEYNRYLSIVDQIIDISPSLVKGYDNEGRAILDYKNLLTDAIAEQEQYLDNQRAIYLGSGPDLFKGKKAQYEDYQKNLGKAGKKLGEALNPGSIFNTAPALAWREALQELQIDFPGNKTWETSYDVLTALYERSSDFLILLRKSGAYTEDEINNIRTALYGLSGSYSQLNSIVAEQISYEMEWAKDQDWYNEIPREALDEFRTMLSEINDPLASYNENLQNVNLRGFEFAQTIQSDVVAGIVDLSSKLNDGEATIGEYNAAVQSFLDGYSGSDIVRNAMEQFFSSLDSGISKTANSVDDLSYSLSGLSESAEQMQKGYDLAAQARKDYLEHGSLQSSTITSLQKELGDEENIEDYLYMEGDALQLDIEKWLARNSAMMDSDISVIEKTIGALNEEKSTLGDLTKQREEAAKAWSEGYNGNVDFSNRKVISGAQMNDAGWSVDRFGYSTLNAQTYSLGEGNAYNYKYDANLVVSLTPITSDGQVLTPQETKDYLQALIDSGKPILEADADVSIGGYQNLLVDVEEVSDSLDDALAEQTEKLANLSEAQRDFYQSEGLDTQITELEKLQAVYDALYSDIAGANLSGMFTDLSTITSTAGDLISAMTALRDGTKLTFADLSGLWQKYPELMKNLDLNELAGMDAKEQQGVINGLLDTYREQYDAVIDKQIAAAEAALALVDANSAEAASYRELIANLQLMKGTDIVDIYGSEATQKTATEQYNEANQKITSSKELVKSAQDDIKKYGKLSADSISKLMGIVGDDWKSFCSDMGDGYELNAEALRKWLLQELDTYAIDGKLREQMLADIDTLGSVSMYADQVAKSYENLGSSMSNLSLADGSTELTYDAYQKLIEVDYRYADSIDYVNGRLVLNRDRYYEITKAISEQTTAAAESYRQEIAQSQEYLALQEKIRRGEQLTPGESARLKEINATIDGLRVLAYECQNATDAFSRFNSASTETHSSEYTSVSNAYKVMTDTLTDAENELYGMTGRTQYKDAMNLLIGVDLDEDQAKAALKKLERYITKDTRTGINNFQTDLIKAGFMDPVTLELDATIDEISDKFGVAGELIRALFSEWEQYGAKWNWEELDPTPLEQGAKSAGELSESTTESKTAIEEFTEQMTGALDMTKELAATDASPKFTTAIAQAAKFSAQILGILNNINKLNGSSIIVNASVNGSASSGSSGGGILGWFKNKLNGLRGGKASANGTPSSAGGKTLVGELGPEMVVDPASGRWYTVGDDGAEFVTLPKNAIVFSAKQTERLLGKKKISERGEATGEAMASGSAHAVSSDKSMIRIEPDGAKKIASSLANTVKNFLNGLRVSGSGSDMSKKVTKSSSSSGAKKSSGGSGSVKEETNEYKALNEQLEHLIEHQEFLYKQAERGYDYSGMEKSLREQARLYKEIMANCEAAIKEMQAKGADDTDENLQEMERAYWSASQSMWEALDNASKLYTDALHQKIDDIQTAYQNLQSAADEFNQYNGITVDTFQALIQHGVQYLSMLDLVDGQYVINREGIEAMVKAEKEQLTVETALSYISNIRQALTDGNTLAVARLVDATNQVGQSTWDLVYAQAALLQSMGLTSDQYDQVLANIEAMRAMSDAVINNITMDLSSSTSSAKDNIRDVYQEQSDSLDKILDLTEELIKYEVNQRIDAINDQVDAYKKIVSLKKESLKTTKDELSYERSLSDKTKEIAKLQAQIDQLSLDNSREAQAEKASLMEKLASLQEDLADKQADHAYEAQTDSLDKMSDAYEESKQEEIKVLQDSISSTEKVYQLAIKRISEQWDTLYQDLIAWNTEAGTIINDEITEAWNKATEAVKNYGSYAEAAARLKEELAKDDSSSSSSSGSHTSIVSNSRSEEDIKKANEAATPRADTKPAEEPKPSDEQQSAGKVVITNQRWNIRSGPGTEYKRLGTEGEGTEFEYTGETNGKWWGIIYKGQKAWIYKDCGKLIETPKYHTGGIVGNEGNQKDREVLALLEKGEEVLTKQQKKGLYRLIDFQKMLSDRLGVSIGKMELPGAQALPEAAMANPAKDVPSVSIGSVEFNPEITVNITHNGKMEDDTARGFGKKVANTAIDMLQEAFERKGISTLAGAKLRQA